MALTFDQYQKRRLISSYFSVVLSISLVLFLLGALGMFLINSPKIITDFKEKVPMSIYLKDEAGDSVINALKATLSKAPFIKKFDFVSKDDAAKNNVDIVGKDYMEFLGMNPLPNSFDIQLKANFINENELKKIEYKLKENKFINEINYDKNLVSLVNENVPVITFWILIISAVFTFIAILLINSSIRLAIHAHRFTIKTMQMVGATKSFIRKPFLKTNILLGLLGALIAVVGVVALTFYVDSLVPTLGISANIKGISIVVLGVFALGALIAFLSTYFATTRFLNLRTDDLY